MVQTVGVVGAGTMGVGIAYVFAVSGCDVTVIEPDRKRRRLGQKRIDEQIATVHRRGKVNADALSAIPQRVRWAGLNAHLPVALDLAIEAVPERADLKRSVLAEIEQRAPGLLASNTSGIAIGELAGALTRPERFLGLHFFNPVWSMPLVEIVRGGQTSDAAVMEAEQAVAQIGKQKIIVADAPGFATRGDAHA